MSRPDRLTVFNRAGLTFDVLDAGPVEGDVVVLLHGFPQRGSSWSAVVPILTQAGYRVLAPDQRGYCVGARPRGRAAYAISELVADVIALIDAALMNTGVTDAGERNRVHLVGHDWGAAVGWAVATLHPDRLHSFTAVSVPHPRAMIRSLFRSTQGLKSWYVGALQVPHVPELLALRCPTWIEGKLRRSGMDEAAIRRFRDEILDDGAFPTAIAWYRAIVYGGPGGESAIRVPTTLVWSDGDVAITRAPVEMCADFISPEFRDQYRLEVLHGVDHWIPERVPGVLAELILQRIEAS